MFTIMHEINDGTQQVFSAVEVQFLPFTEENAGAAGLHLLAGPGEAGPGARVGKLDKGKVFVMNDRGATVARYDLDQPHHPPTS